MVTTTRSPAVRDRYDRLRAGRRHQPRRSHRTALVLSTVVIAATTGYVTLSPPGVVVNARSVLKTTIRALRGALAGDGAPHSSRGRGQRLALSAPRCAGQPALTRRSRLLPYLVGAEVSVAVNSVQSVRPGRVPNLVDVAANTAGTALGVWLVALAQALVRSRGARVGRRGRLRAGLLTVPVLVALAACQPAGGSGLPLPAASDTATASTGAAGSLTVADGWVPDGQSLSPFADAPAITKLNPTLRQAVQDAARAASAYGVDMRVSSGWRSAAYQQALLDAAVAEHGKEAAARYVLSPDRSEHVAGRAVDIGPTDAMSWMVQHGSDYGLCQTYGNEMWHFELIITRGGTCPAPTTDASTG